MKLREVVKVMGEDVTLRERNEGYITTAKAETIEKYMSKEILDSEVEEIRAVSNGTIVVEVRYNNERETDD